MEAQSSQLVSPRAKAQSPIRLLLDGRKIGDGGIGVYIDNTVRGLLELGGVEISVIAAPGRSQGITWRQSVEWISDSSKPYSISEYLLMPRRVDFSRYDIFHTPHYTLPFGISIPSVVTIHDLIHVDFPEAFYYPIVAKRLIASAARRATAIVAVSNDTKRAIINHTGVAAAKVFHIPNSIPRFVESNLDGMRLANITAGARPANSDSYFIAVISNSKPHKGVADLLNAYSAARDAFKSSDQKQVYPRLILVGYGAESLSDKLRRLADSIDGVSVVGAVDSDILRYLYLNAQALVVPSLAEGFCLPALEAQSLGTCIICRPVGALLELVSESDVVAEDLSVGALTQALLKGARNSGSRTINTRSHLERFAPGIVSRQVRDLYQGILNQSLSAESRES